MVSEDADRDSLIQARDAARARARELEHEVGRLRGQVQRLEAQSAWRRTWRRAARAVVYRADRLLGGRR
jgi:hypothetical protein